VPSWNSGYEEGEERAVVDSHDVVISSPALLPATALRTEIEIEDERSKQER